MTGIFSKPKTPPPPAIKPPAPMPDEDALKIAARKEAAQRQGGRASTILTDEKYGL